MAAVAARVIWFCAEGMNCEPTSPVQLRPSKSELLPEAPQLMRKSAAEAEKRRSAVARENMKTPPIESERRVREIVFLRLEIGRGEKNLRKRI